LLLFSRYRGFVPAAPFAFLEDLKASFIASYADSYQQASDVPRFEEFPVCAKTQPNCQPIMHIVEGLYWMHAAPIL
jgi:hypothetical protein